MMLAGIYQPTSGEITFDGARVNDVEARGRNVGIVFQSYALYPNMSVLENVMFPLRFKAIERPEAERRAREIAALVRVEGLLDRRPSQLSGGQQQRVAIARALINEPEVLLADEPTGNLDSRTSVEIMVIFQQLNERGITVIMVTHEPDIAAYAKRNVMMRDGLILDDHLVSQRSDAASQLQREHASTR
jgi:inositol-phosphate transport system ATP-binding protein